MVKLPRKRFIFIVVLSVGIYFGNELITGFADYQNKNYSFFFGGDHVILETAQGTLRGFTSGSRSGRNFYEFLGVPYALPPINDLRFESPVPLPRWKGTRDALGYGHKCLQFDFLISMLVGDEDCLTLNIHTPSELIVNPKSQQKLLPVIVFIFGGLFMFGRTEVYRPEYFMDHEVIFVTVNYRVAAFGFLSSGDGVVRGNMGLKDQVLALKWVQKHIQNFGGDPNLVTIWGESAGGAGCHFHQLSKSSKGLFHRGISMSGTALSNWAINPRPKEQFHRLANLFNCSIYGHNTAKLAQCLKSVDATQLANSFRESRDILHPRISAYAPTLEVVQDEDSFLVEDPRISLKNEKIITNVPWLLGVNDMEGLIYAGDVLLNKTSTALLPKEWLKYAPILWDYEKVEKEKRNEISRKIWEFYLKDHPTFNLPRTLNNLTAIFSDINFYKPLRETLKLQAHLTPMYLYYYTYAAHHGLGQIFMTMPGIFPLIFDGLLGQIWRTIVYGFLGFEEKRWGACHTDELGVLFQLPTLINRIEKGSRDFEFSQTFVHHIVHFAIHGEPMPVNGKLWPAVNSKKPLEYMQLDRQLKLIREPFKERVEFILKLFNEVQVN